jgi:dienelactone hydrolase
MTSTTSTYTTLRRLIKNAINADVAAKTARYHARTHRQDWSDADIAIQEAMYHAADALESVARDTARLVFLAIDPDLYESTEYSGEYMISLEQVHRVRKAGRLIEDTAYAQMTKRFTHW